MNKVKKFEIWSAVFTIIVGSLLHFVFAWSGEWKPLAIFAAVNESTWEHLKLAFWPALLMSIVGWRLIAKEGLTVRKNFCFAQMKKLFMMPFLIVILFYGWRYFFEDNFVYDISIFMVAVIAGHYTAYKLETGKVIWGMKKFAFAAITLLTIIFTLFTFFPPKFFLFHDPVSGGYGIISAASQPK
jgi:hypothetical protein